MYIIYNMPGIVIIGEAYTELYFVEKGGIGYTYQKITKPMLYHRATTNGFLK